MESKSFFLRLMRFLIAFTSHPKRVPFVFDSFFIVFEQSSIEIGLEVHRFPGWWAGMVAAGSMAFWCCPNYSPYLRAFQANWKWSTTISDLHFFLNKGFPTWTSHMKVHQFPLCWGPSFCWGIWGWHQRKQRWWLDDWFCLACRSFVITPMKRQQFGT